MRQVCAAKLEQGRCEKLASSWEQALLGATPTGAGGVDGGWLVGPAGFTGQLDLAPFSKKALGRPESAAKLHVPPMTISLSDEQLGSLLAFQARRSSCTLTLTLTPTLTLALS